MTGWPAIVRPRSKGPALLATLSASLMLGACAQLGGADDDMATAAIVKPTGAETAGQGRSELDRAIAHWAKEHERKPRDLTAALSYARNLKAAGHKDRALVVLQQIAIFHATNRELLSEYGRLALDRDQTSLAQKLLEAADDPAKPDWRVISARGTVAAKQGNYAQAIALYERALAQAPEQPSLLNNLALAEAANGHTDRAEALLRRAAEAPGGGPKVRQNLALVLGLQGKYEEAKQIGSRDLPAESAAANVEFVRRIVQLEPKSGASTQPDAIVTAGGKPALRGSADPTTALAPVGGWSTQVVAADGPAPLKPSQR